MVALIVACGIFGLLIGSFLNVVIYRVPAGQSIVSPPSRCPGCGSEIKAYDNIPIISWLLLRGKCRNCGEPISVRYPLVELLTGVLFAVMAWKFGFSWELPAFLFLAAVGVALAAIDLDTRRLPNVITLPSYPVAVALLVLPAVLDGRWPDFGRALAAGVILFAFYFLLAFIYPAGMGFGDVKLSGLVGIYLGWLGWGALIVGGFLGFALGAIVGVALMVRGRAGRKTALPYGPFMLLGALIAIFVADPISSWYLGLIGL
ncbi:MAG: prepilin peptidase [Actinomycetes bacterium]